MLDTGANASLITEKKARQLKLKIHRTSHTAVQVDGVSDLRILGEIHTIVRRNNVELHLDALVVNHLGADVDILAGTNFHVENDVSSRMAKNTITIQGTLTVQCASPALLTLDKLDTKVRRVTVLRQVSILPGDTMTFNLPADVCDQADLAIEPDLGQSKPFFSPKIISPKDGKFEITNESKDIITLKKNCQPIQIRHVSETPPDLPRTPVADIFARHF